MKVPAHLIAVLWVAVGYSTAELQSANDSKLSRAAEAQLERLAGFPRSGLVTDGVDTSGASSGKPVRQTGSSDPRQTRSSPTKSSLQPDDELQLRIPIDFGELFRIFSDSSSASQEGPGSRDKRHKSSLGQVQLTPDRLKALDKYADRIMQDKDVQSYMLERIKRDGAYGAYGAGGGSGSFVSGLASQLVGSVVGLSSSASKTSSSSSGHSPAPVYGPPVYGPPAHHTYGKENFGVWDFKKAILNTLIQAVKAIGGGGLALTGQIIKGGGFLVSTKGRIISSAGEALTGVGKSLANSAIVQPPQHPPQPIYPVYGAPHPDGYTYDAVAPQLTGHNLHYDGPPPSPDAYHSTFTSASDIDNLQPGLLIAKPISADVSTSSHFGADLLQPDHIETTPIQSHHEQADDTHTDDLEPRKPEHNVKNVVGHLTGTLNIYPSNNFKQPETQSVEEVTPVPGNNLQLQEHNQANYELYPPLGNDPVDNLKTVQQPPNYEQLVAFKNQVDNSQKYEYPQLNYQSTYDLHTYNVPTKYGTPNVNPFKYLPSKASSDNYQSPPDVQIEISNQDITGFETKGYFPRHHPRPGLHVIAMQGPLKIPILGPSTAGLYKNAAFPPTHSNSILGIGKYPGYGPSFDVQQSIEHELRRRRDGPKNKIHRT